MFFGLFGGEKKRVAEMIAAARTGNFEKIKQLLSEGVDINAAEPESGDTPLLAAIDKSQWAAAEFLLQQRPNLNLEDDNGNTPLYLAVSRGDEALALVNQLLDAGAQVDLGPIKGDNAGVTPLHIACATGANGCLETLLRRGASATKQIPSGATPLHTAAIGGDKKTIDLLCKAGGNVTALNADKRTPLHNCGITGNAKAAAALIKYGAELDVVDAEGCTPLMRAVMKNNVEVATVLLDHGADPDRIVHIDGSPFYPLFVAAMNGYTDLVRILIEKGVNVMAKVEGVIAPLVAAKHNGHEAAAKLIAAAINKKKAVEKADKAGELIWRDLLSALNGGKADLIDSLAAKPAFAKLTLDQQLIVQSVLGATGKVQALLSQGASPNASFGEVFFGAPVLYVAAGREGSTDALALLLEAGADPHLTQKDGSNALHVAAKRGNVRAAKLLMGNGVNPNIGYAGGLPPLIDACISGNTRMVDALIDGGADVNATLEMGFCAFAAAIDNKHMKLAEHLLARGAHPNFGEVETLPLAVAEHGSLALIQAIASRGGSIVRPDMLARVAFIAARNKDSEVLDYVLRNSADLCFGNDLNYSELTLASISNHPKLVERYLNRGDDAGHLDVDLETALSLAIEMEHSDVISILRRHGAQVIEYPELSHDESMLKAALEGALGTILNLHDEGVSVNTEDSLGNSPLMMAALNGHVGVVRALYHLGANIDHKNRDGQSASNLAKKAGQEKVLKSLMEFYASDATRDLYGFESEEGERTFDALDAIHGRQTHPFKNKRPYDAEEDVDGEADVEIIDEEENISKAANSLVSDEVADMLSRLETALEQQHIIDSISENDLEVITARIKLIWSRGEGAIPPDQLKELTQVCERFENQSEFENPTPSLFEVATVGNLQEFRKLIRSGAKIEETLPDGTTLLMTASQNGHVAIVKELIALGIDVNKRQSETFTALIFAVILGHENIVKILVSSGADVNAGHSMPSSRGSSGGQTALTVAAARKNISMCKLLIKLGADVNVVTEAGYTALMWSLAGTHDGDCAKLLLQAGADPDPDAVPSPSVSFATLTSPLILAATNGVTDIVKELIRRNVRLDKTDGNGCTALKQAAHGGHVDIVLALTKAGASVEVADHEGWTALMSAASKGRLKISKVLINAGANVAAVANSGETALAQSVGSRSDGLALSALRDLNQMLDREADDGNGVMETIDLADDALKLTNILLKTGANPNVELDGKSLLEIAIQGGDEELVKLLKNNGATEVNKTSELDVDEHNKIVPPELELENFWDEQGEKLLDAVLDCNLKPVAEILDDGANINYVNSEGKTALSIAIYGLNEKGMTRQMRRGLREIADYLLRRGADVNVLGCDPTPLGWAACAGEIFLVRALIKRGADIEARLGGRTTALLTAIAEKREDCAIALIKAEANLHTRTTGGQTALHLAAAMGLERVVEVCLVRHSDLVNTVDENFETPLMLAAREGYESIIQSLLSFAPDKSMKNKIGKSAANIAQENGYIDIVEALT
jgi:ankyrin repeat protein